MKKYLIVPAIAALMVAPAFAQGVNDTKATTKGEDKTTTAPVPNTGGGMGMSAPGNVNDTKATTKGEDAATPGMVRKDNPTAGTGTMSGSSAPGSVDTTTRGGIANPSAPDAANPVAGQGSGSNSTSGAGGNSSGGNGSGGSNN